MYVINSSMTDLWPCEFNICVCVSACACVCLWTLCVSIRQFAITSCFYFSFLTCNVVIVIMDFRLK